MESATIMPPIETAIGRVRSLGTSPGSRCRSRISVNFSSPNSVSSPIVMGDFISTTGPSTSLGRLIDALLKRLSLKLLKTRHVNFVNDRIRNLFSELEQICEQYKKQVPGRRRAWPKAVKERIAEIERHGVSGYEVAKRVPVPYMTIVSWRSKTKSKSAGPP